MTIVQLDALRSEYDEAQSIYNRWWKALHPTRGLEAARADLALARPEALPILDRAMVAVRTTWELEGAITLALEAANDRLGLAMAGLQRGQVIEFAFRDEKPQRMRVEYASVTEERDRAFLRGHLLKADGTLGKRQEMISSDHPFRVLGVWTDPKPRPRR